MDYTNVSNFFHPHFKKLPVKYLSQSEKVLMGKLTKAQFIHYDPKYKAYIANKNKGFPRLLIHINCDETEAKSKEKNYQHYLNIETLPPPLQAYMQTLNNIKVEDIEDVAPAKPAFEKVLNPDYINKAPPIVYGNNKQTLFAAAKRQVKMAPVPDAEIAKDFLEYCKKKIEQEIGDYLTHFSYDFSQWYNHLTAAKQKLITPIHNYYHHPEKLIEYSSKQIQDMLSECYTAICKAEIQDVDGKPRMVCSIPQKIKYIMGPITWALEEICAKHLNGYCGNKNLTQIANEINEFKNRGFTTVVEGDGSAFDNSQDILLKAVDRYIYSRVEHAVYHVPREDFRRISHSYYKQMKVKYPHEKKLNTYLTYYVLGTVFSGDCDTTLCNTIRMAMYNRYANEKMGLQYNKDFVVFSKGDDFSVLYKPYVPKELIEKVYATYFLPPPTGDYKSLDNREGGLGQICKFLTIDGLNSFKFCSLRSWYKNEDHDVYLTRDPTKLYNLSQYSIKYKGYNTQQRMQYNLDLMISYLTNYSKLNIFTLMAAAHANEFLRLYDASQNQNPKDYNKKMLSQLKINLVIQPGQGEQRDHIENSSLGSYIYYYETQGREKFYKINNSYWETMKRLMMVHEEALTDEEAYYINQQIQSEFDINYLAYLLGINLQQVPHLIMRVLQIKDIAWMIDPKNVTIS